MIEQVILTLLLVLRLAGIKIDVVLQNIKSLFYDIFTSIKLETLDPRKLAPIVQSQTSGGAPAQQSCGACKAPPH